MKSCIRLRLGDLDGQIGKTGGHVVLVLFDEGNQQHLHVMDFSAARHLAEALHDVSKAACYNANACPDDD